MKTLTLLLGIFSMTACFSQEMGKWFNKESISTTVFLEKNVSGQFIPHGTGFLIFPYKSKSSIIVTCDHVLRNSAIYVTLEVNIDFRNYVRSLSRLDQQQILNLLNTDRIVLWNINENFLRVKVNLIKDSTLFQHPTGLDVAAFKVNIPGMLSIKDSLISVTIAKRIPKSRINTRDKIALGDDIYFIGFPFGIGTPQSIPTQQIYSSSTPRHLLRKGTLSWISNDYDEFLLDAISFGGNSGSPVFQVSYENGKPPYYLIGIIIGHLGDNISNANYGLARCLSIEEINKVINLADR